MKVVHIRLDPYDVYIGRAGKGQDGYFGNPVVVGRPCLCGQTHNEGGSTLRCYYKSLQARLTSESGFHKALLGLRGKTLGCFCAPKGGVDQTNKPFCCHGQVLLWWLEKN